MPIETDKRGNIMATGQGVRTFQLVALKHALKLFEKTGMRPNRLVHPLKIANKLCGLTGRKYDKLYEALDKLIEESNEKDQQANDEGNHG